MKSADLDHTSFAVHDAMAWARRLRRELGAVPVAGEALPEFRYLVLYAGTAETGARIELLEPAGPGFLTRHLERRGEGPHHITVTVPDLAVAVARARALGLTVTGEVYDHPSWQEAFLVPDGVHGVVIQLAHSDAAYPEPAELLTTTERRAAEFPSSRGATDPTWWEPVWETAAGPGAVLGATLLHSTDLATSRRLFAEVLEADVREAGADLECRWPSGSVVVRAHETPGVAGMDVVGGPADGLAIGPTRLRPF